MLLKVPYTLFFAVPIFDAFERGQKVRKIPVFRIEIEKLRPEQASKVGAMAAPGAWFCAVLSPLLSPCAAARSSLEACPGRNYDPISILETGIFRTFRPLSNAPKIGTAQNKVYGPFNVSHTSWCVKLYRTFSGGSRIPRF